MQERLERILEECRKYTQEGELADYIPELAKADRNKIGIYIATDHGDFYAGDWQEQFTIQSIVKTIFLSLAAQDNGVEFVKDHVGVEATGKPFNAIDYGEHKLLKEHINPMVNIGAIAVCELVKASSNDERLERLLNYTRDITGNPNLEVDHAVYLSEKRTGHKNRALAYLLKNAGMIQGDVEELLDVYFAMCSVKVNCQDLAKLGLLLSNRGKGIKSGRQIIPADDARFINAVLTTSGMYDGSGTFATKVGLPAKSGVGGGIMANRPGKGGIGIGIFSPALDSKGNSVAGIKMLEMLSNELDLSIF